jgi:RNA polymerase sigma-70 factor (ECF subfamily)
LSLRKNYTSEQWIASFRNGEEQGFNYYFRLYYKPIRFFATRYIVDMQVAEDIVQESFVKLWESREKINDEKHLRNWMYRAVYHGCVKWKRAAGREQTSSLESSPAFEPIVDMEENLVKAEKLRQIQMALDELPKECQKVMRKLYIENKGEGKAAQELHLSINTIKTHRKKGLKLLRLRLKKGFLLLLGI